RALDAIDRGVQAQAHLLDQLMDVSRIVSGKFELHLAPAQLGKIVDAACDAVRPAAESRKVRIRKTIAPGLPTMSADADRLQQVAINLLSNAVKFSPDGGLVDVELRERDDATAEIVVRDHGIGITRDFLPYVFDRYRQSRPISGVANQGLGLGLSI